MSILNAISADTPTIQFSVNAADKVASLLEHEENPNQHLRVYITGGGCSGFQYGFKFDTEISEDDLVVEQTCSNGINKVKLLIDSLSYQYMPQAEIDYVKNVQGEQFVIKNPNAKTTCGCGSSFSLGDDE